MKLLNYELRNNICADVRYKVFKHAPYGNPVRKQIRKNLGLWDDDNLIMSKIDNPKWNIGNDLDETT